jgi:hypothetical protein
MGILLFVWLFVFRGMAKTGVVFHHGFGSVWAFFLIINITYKNME